ncbi:MAG TPA: hypothetical protein P5132_00920 [Bacteroidales bacterium]|nr:hypothetical protein [Bacteroidales bacterium]
MNQKEIIKNIKSGNKDLILEALKVVEQNGNSEILKHMLILYKETTVDVLREKIIKILDNLKNQDCAPVLAESIHNTSSKEELFYLVSACWKNGLNYHDYLEIFVNIFIVSDFNLAFEAFTVIDNMDEVNDVMAQKCVNSLQKEFSKLKQDKQALGKELIQIINNLPRI